MPDIQIPTPDLSVMLQLAIVFGWATALLLVDLFVPPGRKQITGWLAVAGLIAAAAAGIPLWGSQGSTFGDMLRLDNYALALNWIFLLVGAISIVISLDY
jgi:NADH-quinone oxidoreductase subunit N